MLLKQHMDMDMDMDKDMDMDMDMDMDKDCVQNECNGEYIIRFPIGASSVCARCKAEYTARLVTWGWGNEAAFLVTDNCVFNRPFGR